MRAAMLLIAGWLLLTPSARAELHCETPSIDVGTIRTGPDVTQTFPITNRGSEPVEIIDARSSCGCAAPQVDWRRLEPGAIGNVTVTIHTLTQPAGRHAWRTLLRYRADDKERELALEVKADLIADLRIEPPTLVLHANGELSHPLRLVDTRRAPLRIVRAAASSPNLALSLEEPRLDAASGNRMQLLQATVRADHPVGRHEHVLSLFTDDPAYPELRVPLTVVKKSPRAVRALPAEVRFDGSGAARLVRLRSGDESAVVVDRVEASHPSLSATWASGPGNDATLRVRRQAPANSPFPADAFLNVHLRSPAETTLRIPVRGER